MPPTPAMDSVTALSDQLALSGIFVWLMQLAKKSRLVPWIHQYSYTLNRVIGIGFAVVSSLGIHVVAGHYDPMQGGDYTIHLPSLPMVLDSVFDFSKSMTFQEVIYLLVRVMHALQPPGEFVSPAALANLRSTLTENPFPVVPTKPGPPI